MALSPVAWQYVKLNLVTKLKESKNISHEKLDLLLSKIIPKDCKFYGSNSALNHTSSKPKKPLEKSKHLHLSQTREIGVEI